MDGLLTLSSPRSTLGAPPYAYKVSARRRPGSTGKSPRADKLLSPRPPPSRPNPRTCVSNNGQQIILTPRGRASSVIELFRSGTVLEEIVRVENLHTRSSLSVDQAFQLLHRTVPQTASGNVMRGLSHQQLLDGLETACWHRFSPANRADGIRVAAPYSELYRGVLESLRDKQTSIKALKSSIRETTQRTNELPRRIRNHEQEIATTIASFVTLSAASLDCTIEVGHTHVGKHHPIDGGVDTAQLAERVRTRIATLRRRKELRQWACDQLRSQINDHMTRASELQKEITVLVGDVKKEELVHKVKAGRMEEALAGMASMAVSVTGQQSSMSDVVATKVLVGGGLAAMATAVSLSIPGKQASPGLLLHERLALAHEKRHELEQAVEARKEVVRRRTEAIFDVRNDVHAMEATKADLTAQAEALDEAMVHIQRACTPRPDWNELQRVVNVTTAVDHVGSRSLRASLPSRDRRGQRGESEEDDEMGTVRKLKKVLASTWTTVDKVDALAQELCRIRDKYHGGDEIKTERAKLVQLQQEIRQILEQLTAIRSVPSRGSVAT